jgi:uncharacterized protein YutE (UPF0331/DUF86 family)
VIPNIRLSEADYLNLLTEQVTLVMAARNAFSLSWSRAEAVLQKIQGGGHQPTVAEKETLEALTSRFTRLSDILFQRLFRTLDQVELIDEGTNIDRLNRMEKRGVIASAEIWKQVRQLRNSIAHEYLIQASDSVVLESIQYGQELLDSVDRFTRYAQSKGYLT